MNMLPNEPADRTPSHDHRSECDHPGQCRGSNDRKVVHSALLAGGGFATTVGSITIATGQWPISSEIARYAITTVGVIAAMALFVAALYIMFRRR